MAIRFDASGDKVSSSSVPSSPRSFTMAGWFKITTDRNTYSCFMNLSADTDNAVFVETDSDGTTATLYVYNAAAFTSQAGPNMTAGTWYYLAITSSSAGSCKLWYAPYGTWTLSSVTNSRAAGTWTPNLLVLGDSVFTGEFLNGCADKFKMWTAELTQAELQMEMQRTMPVRTANLNRWTPMFAGTSERLRDYGSGALNWTTGGTLADEAGVSIPWGVFDPQTFTLNPSSGTDNLTATGIATGSPSLGTPVIGQTHTLTATGLTTGQPSLASSTLGQTHVLTATGVTTGAPTVGTPVLTESHALSATGITTGSPVLDASTIGQTHILSGTGIATTAPAVGTPVIGQTHTLSASGIATGSPTLATSTLGQTHVLTATGLTTGQPDLGSPSMSGADSLTATGIATGAPSLGAPVITQTHILSAITIVTDAPVYGTPTLTEIYALSADSLFTGIPSIGTATLGQTHVLIANSIVTGIPVLDAPSAEYIMPTIRAWNLHERNFEFTLEDRDTAFSLRDRDINWTIEER